MRIELHSGSYLPDFRIAPEPSIAAEGSTSCARPAMPAPMTLREQPPAPQRHLQPCSGLRALLRALPIAADHFEAVHIRPPRSIGSGPRFSNRPAPAILCVGQRLQRDWDATGDTSRNIVPSDPTPQADIRSLKFCWTAAQNVVLPDVIFAIYRLSGLTCRKKRKAFRVRLLG